MNYMESRYAETEESPERDRWKVCKPPRPKFVITQSRVSRRVEKLKKEKEEAELAKLKSKPTISKKSMFLAKRAEKKFFSNLSRSYTDILLASKPILNKDLSDYLITDSRHKSESFSGTIPREVYPKLTSDSIAIQRTIEIKNSSNQSKQTDSSLENKIELRIKHKKSTGSCDLTPKFSINKDICKESPRKGIDGSSKRPPRPRKGNSSQSPQKTRVKSLYYMSVIDRNQLWQEQKNLKLRLKRREKKAEELRKCTFTPTMYRKIEF